MPNRVVITGYGAITPLGNSAEDSWDKIVAGINGVGPITHFNNTNFTVKVAAEVKNFDPTKYIDPTTAKYADRFTQFALVASLQAIESAKLIINEQNKYDIRILIGSGIGGIGTLEKQIEILLTRGPNRVSPYIVPMMIADNASGQVSIKTGIMGSNMSIVSSCSTGSDAIGLAYNMIKYGECSVFIAGGADAAITPIGVAGFAQAGALSKNPDPNSASRPFDAKRDGFVIGEGAGIVVLEELNHAIKRRANIKAEIVGYGATSDAFHITHPSETGDAGAEAIRQAIRNLEINKIDYINAHGTSTPLNDKNETNVLKKVFGKRAYNIPISSIKSMVGHMLGAAGAFEIIICSKVIEHNIIPPTINYQNPDPECDLNYVPNKAIEKRVDTAISNTFGFGGHNSVIALRKYHEN